MQPTIVSNALLDPNQTKINLLDSPSQSRLITMWCIVARDEYNLHSCEIVFPLVFFFLSTRIVLTFEYSRAEGNASCVRLVTTNSNTPCSMSFILSLLKRILP